MEERLQLRDAELRLLVPEDKRPPVYGWDQPPGLDGYSATQEREEEYGYLAKYCSTLNPRSNRYSNSDYTGERISDLDSDDEESRPRGRSLTRRERTGYGVPTADRSFARELAMVFLITIAGVMGRRLILPTTPKAATGAMERHLIQQH
ncbi:hypothetical protein IFR05_002823 [Cadophora sp. M221]|nr:hypothetical protein IFR05_002823 [Cadophora sp. M221]